MKRNRILILITSATLLMPYLINANDERLEKSIAFEQALEEHEEGIGQLIKRQETPTDKPSVNFGGYVKAENFWDTRQVVAIRDDQFLFFPEKRVIGAGGGDINATGDFNMLAIQTRLNARMTGPEIGRTKLSGFVEGDFFGSTEDTINGFRLRHAMVRFDWKRAAILLGQYWYPIFIEECNAADVLSFNSGAPYDPYARYPQFRFEYRFADHWRFITALASESVGFTSIGPNGFSTEYLRNSMVPLLHAQLQAQGTHYVIGAGVDMRSLKPRLKSEKNYKVDERITSGSVIAYAKYMDDSFEFKVKGSYGSNAVGYLMLGGYGIASVNESTDARTYTNIRIASVWAEITGGKKFRPGIFVGVCKNLGAGKRLAAVGCVPNATSFKDLIYGRGQDIDLTFRVSPRLFWIFKSFNVGAEIEITQARYGTVCQNGSVVNADSVTNARFMFASYYYF